MLNKETLKNLKLIIFDLDGSLLKNDGTIGEETKRLIKKLEESWSNIFICNRTASLGNYQVR